MAEYKEFQNVDQYLAEYRQAVEMNPECGQSRYNLAMGLMGKRLLTKRKLN